MYLYSRDKHFDSFKSNEYPEFSFENFLKEAVNAQMPEECDMN